MSTNKTKPAAKASSIFGEFRAGHPQNGQPPVYHAFTSARLVSLAAQARTDGTNSFIRAGLVLLTMGAAGAASGTGAADRSDSKSKRRGR